MNDKDVPGYIYVCGDAKNMVKDVENTLLQTIQKEGCMTEEDSKKVMQDWKKHNRFVCDVWA